MDTKRNVNRDPSLPAKAFIDADVFIAIANEVDANHELAFKLSKIIAEKHISLITSNFAFGEAITVVSQKIGLAKALKMATDIQNSTISIIEVDRANREKALRKFALQSSKNTRFTDMINMVLMDELEIEVIFSFDEHYPKNGYKLLSELG